MKQEKNAVKDLKWNSKRCRSTHGGMVHMGECYLKLSWNQVPSVYIRDLIDKNTTDICSVSKVMTFDNWKVSTLGLALCIHYFTVEGA